MKFVKEIDSGDLETLDALLPANVTERRTLADIIFAKLEGGDAGNTAIIHKAQQGNFISSSTLRHVVLFNGTYQIVNIQIQP